MEKDQTTTKICVLSAIAFVIGIVITVVFGVQTYLCIEWLRTHSLDHFTPGPSDSEIKRALVRCLLITVAGLVVTVSQVIIMRFCLQRRRPDGNS
jgi:ABC-type spermidine/putrescine transport system permease subunit II